MSPLETRCHFSRRHLNILTLWLCENGWIIEKPKGIYEVLRARKPDRKELFMVFDKDQSKKRLFVYGCNVDILQNFMKEKIHHEKP